MLEIILGKNNVGKDKYIFNCIDKDLDNNEKALLIVPSQMRLEMEKKYLNFSKREGILDMDITSFSRLADKYLEEKHIDNEKVISKLDKTIILRKIISEHQDVFNIFNKVKNKPGFWASIDILIDLFRKEGIELDNIENINLTDKFLELKLKEIGEIYKIYLSEIENKYIDSISEMDLFTNDVENIEKYKDMNIYIYGHNNFTKNELLAVYMLINVAKKVTISLVTDVRNVDEALKVSENTIYFVANQTFITISQMAEKINTKFEIKKLDTKITNQKEDILFLAENIFKDGKKEKYLGDEKNITITYTKNMQTEIQNVSKVISKLIREGYRYKDFAIYTNDIEKYQNVFSKIFLKYNIPYYLDTKENIFANSLVIYLTSLLEVISKSYDTKSIFKLVKTGLTDVEYKDICYIENYCLKYNINYNMWLNEFKVYKKDNFDKIEYDEEKLNEIRIKIIKNIKSFKDIFVGRKTARKLAKEIYIHIQESGILENYEKQIDVLKEKGYYEKAYIYAQVSNKIVDILESIVKVYQDEYITFNEFKDILEYAIKDVTLSSLPTTLDKVIVCDIDKSRIDQKKVVFILGVNENKLPKQINEDVLLRDADLIKIEDETNIKVRNTTINKTYMQRYNIVSAISSAIEKLYISYSSSETSGAALRPSSIIYVIKKMYPNLNIIEEVTKDFNTSDLEDSLYSKSLFTTNCIKSVALINSGEEKEKYKDYAKIYKEYKTDKLKEILSYIRKEDKLDEESIKSLYGNNINTTVTRLESFKKCPFSYFMKYAMKAKEREVYKIEKRDIGTFMHGVLENLSSYLTETGTKYHEILIDNRYEKIVDNIVNSMIEDDLKMFGDGKKSIALKNRLTRRIKNVVKIIAESFNSSYFEQLGVEIEFGQNSIFAPIKIDLDDGRSMYITGKIDRVDVYETENEVYTRVIDYKSSKKTLTLDNIREGISLQLITYMNALMKNQNNFFKGKEVIPTGMLYFTLALPKIKKAEYEADIDKLKKEVRDGFKLNGIYISDVEILKLMDKNYDTSESLINVTSKSKNNKLDKENFILECQNIDNILKEIGNEILSGNAEIKPNKKGYSNNKSPCDYCEYVNVCRKEIKC